MAAGVTYEPIATTTLSSTSASVTFSSIPSTYTDLIIVTNEIGNSGSNENGIQFNSDTASNYSTTYIAGNGSTASSSRNTSVNKIWFGGNIANMMSTIHIMNYANTTTYKTAIIRTQFLGGGNQHVAAVVGLWRSTAAINTIKLDTFGSAYNYLFTVGSTFTLYGIKAA